jgi:hypothetical protein
MATKQTLDWTPVDVSKSSKPIQAAFSQYENGRAALEAAVTKALQARKEIPAGHTVKIGLMFNKVSYAFVPISGTAASKSVAL